VAGIAVSEHAPAVVDCVGGCRAGWVFGDPISQVIARCKIPAERPEHSAAVCSEDICGP